MNTDELRAAVEWAEDRTHHGSRKRQNAARALLLLDKQNAALREENDVLTGQHERDELENAELRRVLQLWQDYAERMGMTGLDFPNGQDLIDKTRRLLAGEVQPAKCQRCGGGGIIPVAVGGGPGVFGARMEQRTCPNCHGTGEVHDA